MDYFLVYREYTKKERPVQKERHVFYGWSKSKKVIKAFLSQRDPKKYRCFKISDEDPRFKRLDDDAMDEHSCIDFIKLKSAKDPRGEDVIFFTTTREMLETEIHIQRYFHNLASLESIESNTDTFVFLNMLLNLDSYYLSALTYLGYKPRELDAIFDSADSADNYDNIDDIEESISSVYEDNMYSSPNGIINGYREPFGSSVLNDVYSKIIYSIESFIKILKNDL